MRKYLGKFSKTDAKKGKTDNKQKDSKGKLEDSSRPFTMADLLRPIQTLSQTTKANRPALFIRKLKLCSVIFDWHAPDTAESSRAKDIKRGLLLELVEFLQNTDEQLFSQQANGTQTIPEIIKMVSANLFRTLPPPVADLDAEEEDPLTDPAWPHLQIVFELFLRVCVSPDVDAATLKRNITGAFIVRFLELFNSDDHRERDYLKTILHRLYAKCMSLRQFIRKSIHNVFYEYIYENPHHSGIGELLEILGSIINGLALPLKMEHRLFLENLLVPLHKVNGLAHFHPQLAYCVSQFVDKDPQLSIMVIGGLLKYWPATDSAKELLFLNELEELLDLTQSEQFEALIPPLFTRMAKCIGSPHFQVAERSLFFWQNEHINELIAQHSEQIFPLLAQDLQATHWNKTVNDLTVDVLKSFIDLDAILVEQNRKEKAAQAEENRVRRITLNNAWSQLEAQHGAALQALSTSS
jgi:serine/threonine-protein phosphatase 2A regulatory subunit B'